MEAERRRMSQRPALMAEAHRTFQLRAEAVARFPVVEAEVHHAGVVVLHAVAVARPGAVAQGGELTRMS